MGASRVRLGVTAAFGGAILVAVLGTFIADALQCLNGLRNVLAAVVTTR